MAQVKFYLESNNWYYTDGRTAELRTPPATLYERYITINDEIQIYAVAGKRPLFKKPALVTEIQKSSTPGDNYASVAEFISETDDFFSASLGSVSIIDEESNAINQLNPFPNVNYNGLFKSNIDQVRSDSTGWTGGDFNTLVDDVFSSIENASVDNPKTILIWFKRPVNNILARIRTSTEGGGNFSNFKFTLLYADGRELVVSDNSLDNTKHTDFLITAPDLVETDGIRLEFFTSDTVTLSSFIAYQINYQAAFLQTFDSITGDLKNPTSTNGFLNVFSKTKQFECYVNKWGQNDDIDTGTTPETIWDGSNLYTYSTAGVTYAASSTDAGDNEELMAELITVEPGTGDYIALLTPLTINGQTPVDFVPSNGYPVIGCNRAYNNNGTPFSGDIYIYENTATVVGGIPTDSTLVRSIVTTEAQQTRQTPYIVPDVDCDGTIVQEGHVIKWECNVIKQNNIAADVYFMVQEPGKIFRARDNDNTKNGSKAGWVWGEEAPLKIPTKSKVEIRCINISANDGAIVGKFQIQKLTENEPN